MTLAYWTFVGGFYLGVAATVVLARLKVRMQIRSLARPRNPAA